jgi:transcriptional regulator with XRE-family HTH domain
MPVQATNTFRIRLREAMEKAGISQRELAERANTSYPGINRILQGKQAPTLELADRLSDAVGVHLTDLLEKNSRRNPSRA